MANEVNGELKRYIDHLAKVFSKDTGIHLSGEYLVSQVEFFNYDYKTEEQTYNKQKEVLPGIYHKALRDLTTRLFKDIMYTTEYSTVDKKIETPSEGSNAKTVTGNSLQFKKFMMSFDELITSISIAYIKDNKKNKTILTVDSHKVFGGMEARDFANILKPIRNQGITNSEKLEIDSNGSIDSLMNDLERHVRGVKGYHHMELDIKDFSDRDEERDVELNNKQELYQNALNLAKDKNEHNFKEDFVSHRESLAQDIEKMATAYTLLREKYQNKSFGHKWLTRAGWAESKAINAARKQMKEALGIKTDKEFNTIMKQISEKDSKFTSDIGIEVKNLNGLYNKNKDDYQQNIADNLIKIGYLKQNVVIPDEKVNDNSKVDEALIDISGNQKENVIDTSKVK